MNQGLEHEISQALKLGCREGVFIFRNLEGIVVYIISFYLSSVSISITGKILEFKCFFQIGLAEAKDNEYRACHMDITPKGEVDFAKLERLNNLKYEVDSKIPSTNKFTFTISANDSGISKENTDHMTYLENMTAAVAMRLRDLFDEYEKTKLHFPSTKKGELCLETLIHLQHCKKLLKVYNGTGLEYLLSKIQMLLMHGTKTDHQLIIVKGDPGCGKSHFLSKVCSRARELFGKDTILIPRFIGITPKSKDKQQILRDICVQLNFVLQQNISLEEYDESHLTNYFYGLANRISKGQHNLVIMLDGVNNLENSTSGDNPSMIDWFSVKLPPKVHLIISYRPHDNFLFQKLEGKRNNVIDSMIIFPVWTTERIGDALTFTLAKHKRVIAKNKEKLLINHLQKASPFVLQNVLHMLTEWHVDYNFINNHFPLSNEEIVHKQLDQLEFRFGHEIVEAVCRYITLSNFGLSETELLDILSCNNDVILTIIRSCNSEVFRFPWFLWIHLKTELGTHLRVLFTMHMHFLENLYLIVSSTDNFLKKSSKP